MISSWGFILYINAFGLDVERVGAPDAAGLHSFSSEPSYKKEKDLFSDFLISRVRTDALNGPPSESPGRPPKLLEWLAPSQGWLRGTDPISEF